VTSGLTPEEVEAIKYMAEEEKLALDTYTTLGSMYPDMNVFSNIAESEETHVKAVLALAENYGVNVTLGPPGEFRNAHLQELYDELTAKGRQSLRDALEVGALVEETDIKDLQEWVGKVVHEDINQTFQCLMLGTRNHLRAFTSILLKQFGIEYQPQVISEEEYEEIVGSPKEPGWNICKDLNIDVGG